MTHLHRIPPIPLSTDSVCNHNRQNRIFQNPCSLFCILNLQVWAFFFILLIQCEISLQFAWNLNALFYRKEWSLKTLMYRTVLWTLWERERVGRFGRMALKHVKYHVWNELPVQVQRTILDAWGWCTGTTQRDGMGREEGGRLRMGNTCIPMADSFWCLAKLIELCKVWK